MCNRCNVYRGPLYILDGFTFLMLDIVNNQIGEGFKYSEISILFSLDKSEFVTKSLN